MDENGKLTLGSLFSGSGAFELGGMLAGIRPVFASEVEPFPIRVTTKRLPFVKHYGDVNSIRGDEVEPVDIITFGSPCFPAGTLVLTDKGYTEIERIEVGMRVLTHKGRWRKVTAAGSRQAETIVLKGNHYGLECTKNHPIYCSSESKIENKIRIEEEKSWIPAADMKGRLWGVPRKIEKTQMISPHYSGSRKQKPMPLMDGDFFYFVGRWLGDGWVRDGQRPGRPEGQCSGQIYLCDSYDKEDELRSIVEKVTSSYSVERCRTAIKFRFCGQVLCNWLTDNFGKYAGGKYIMPWVYTLPEEYRQAILDGLFDSDGYRPKENEWRVTTISKKLAEGLRILGEVQGYSTTVFRTVPCEYRMIEGRKVTQKPCYMVAFSRNASRPHLTDAAHAWYRVRSAEPTGEVKTVYNLTVEDDNSYVADGIVVHNCQNLSIAGKRAGLDGKQSSLFFQAIRIIKEMRCATDGRYPRFIVWENVPGAFSSNGGEDFRAVLNAVCSIKAGDISVPRPPKGKWANAGCIMADGFSLAWRVVDACLWGVPQRRKRIYLVADFTGGSAGKVLFESEGVSGYTPQGFRAWQGTAGGAAEGFGAAGGICLNDMGGQYISVDNEMACTLRAQSHGHPPCVLESAGFCTEHSADSRGIGYEEETSPTLRAGTVPAAVALENHPTDSRVKVSEDNMVQTLTSRMGTGGGNVPLVMDAATPKTLKIRAGGGNGGKGALIQDDKSATLSCNNDQTVFVPFCKGMRPHSAEEAPTWKDGEVANTLNTFDIGESRCNELVVQAFGICSKESNAMKSGNPHSGFYEAQTARTLDCNCNNPSSNQGGIAVVAVQGSMIGRDDKNGPQGSGVNEDVCFSLTGADRHAVAYPTYCTSKNSYFMRAEKELANTLVATDYKDPPVINDVRTASGKDVFGTISASMGSKQWLGNQEAFSGDYHIVEPDYIVRRLTPTECARLQGFPDWWCDGLGTENPTEEEMAFWREVFETHRKIMGTSTKPKSDSQIRKWLKDPHSDSAEYRMWGNGCALPNVYFVLCGIVYYAQFPDFLL